MIRPTKITVTALCRPAPPTAITISFIVKYKIRNKTANTISELYTRNEQIVITKNGNDKEEFVIDISKQPNTAFENAEVISFKVSPSNINGVPVNATIQ